MLEYTQDNLQKVISAVKKHLTSDLINKGYRERNSELPEFGQCLNASGTVHHFFKDQFHLYSAEDEKNYGSFSRGKFYHWWLVDKDTGDILDITANQYKDDRQNLQHLYSIGKKASGTPGYEYRKRVNVLIDRVKRELNMADELVVAKSTSLSKGQLHDIMSEIAEVGRTVVNSHLDLGIVIAKHEGETYWDQLREELTNWMDNSVISMYVRIGNHAWLVDESNREKLPPSYNALYILSDIEPDNLERLDAKKKISPSMTIAEARKLKEQYGNKKVTTRQTSKADPLRVSVSIKFDDKAGKARLTKSALNELKLEIENNGGKVSWSEF